MMSINQLSEMLKVFELNSRRSPRRLIPFGSLGLLREGSSSRMYVSETTSLSRGLNVCSSVPANDGKTE
jgi:hypothetical protein